MVDYEIEDMINRVLFNSKPSISTRAVKTMATYADAPLSAKQSQAGSKAGSKAGSRAGSKAGS